MAISAALDQFAQYPKLLQRLRDARVGLLAHGASVTNDFVHIADVLKIAGIQPALWFAPEHGFYGTLQDMATVSDEATGENLIRSLYGQRFDDLTPRAEDLAKIDLLLIDLQDVGSRYYTFVWTAVLALRACTRAGIEVIVLDRPNPIGTRQDAIEGDMQDRAFLSFVGLEPIPVRHSSTLGALVAYFAERDGTSHAVSIVPARGGADGANARSWPRGFVWPSPNMPTFETALVYPGGCLLEGTNLSEGRGTTRPFEVFGAPWLDEHKLTAAFHSLQLPGIRVRPLAYEPTFHKYAQQLVRGVQVHVTNETTFRPYASYLALITLAHHHHPDQFRFRTERYEFVDHIPAFDLLTGSASARAAIEAFASPNDVVEITQIEPDVARAFASETVTAFRRHSL